MDKKDITVSPNRQRSYSWRNRVRDPALTTMLAVQCIIIFASPFAAMGYEGIREALQLLFFAFTILVCLLSRGLISETLAVLALLCALTGFVLQLVAPSSAAVLLAYAGSISAFIVASYTLGYATLAPGVVTVHRVLGAIALYLNLGLMFAAVYRLIWYFIPHSLTNIPAGAGWQAYGAILYFSFVTLTSTGFGDISPVHPLVRTLANVEAIIGQLYPATLLARLITLELRRPRRRS
ncbi:MAG: potassium channel family protein [Stellaceae bacterium]